jgi:branched-chain amino acid transport system substrate-binding protein
VRDDLISLYCKHKNKFFRREYLKKKLLTVLIGLLLISLLTIPIAATGCGGETTTPTTQPTTSQPTTTAPPTTTGPTPPEQDEIVLGASRDITGPQAGFQEYGYAPIYKMWAEEVNAAGGINVAGKMLTVRIIEYDDGSDPAVCTRNIEKLVTEDHVDFLLGPTGTAMLFAAAPIANKYKTMMICGEGGATTLEPEMPGLPYVFSVLNYSNHFQMPVFADIMTEVGAKTAYICYMADLHGAEYNASAQGEFALAGITVVGSTSIPITISDMNPIIEEAKALNPDIFCMFAYPNQNILFMQTAMALDFSPKCVLIGPGCNFGFFPLMFPGAIEGVMGEGAWNAKSSPDSAELAAKLTDLVGVGNMDWWGANLYYATLQYLQQAIEEAASIDTDKVLEVYHTAHFPTVLGDFYWDIQGEAGGGLLPLEVYTGQIGQWQEGVFEVIDPGVRRTADPIYPKAPWPES